jgi:hypothetical protein
MVSLITSKGKEEMNKYRNAISALVLAIVFTTPAFAADDGVIHTEKTPPPPPPPPQVTSVIHMETSAPTPEGCVLTDITLNLLQNLLKLL